MILVVDDDATFLEIIKATLKPERGLFFVKRGVDAVKFAKNLDISVVLVDLQLDAESGFDVIRDIHSACPALPIIAISGACTRAVLESTKMFGAIEVLEKPVTAEWKKVVDRVRQTEISAAGV